MRFGIRASLVLTLALTACGGSGTDTGAQPAPSATTQVPSPTPTLPAVAEDLAAVKRAVVTAADLGKPWIEPKSVNKAEGGKGELCPGQPNARALAKPRASERRQLTEGSQQGAAIGSFNVDAHEFGTEQKWREAFATATGGCASWNAAEGTYVELETVTAPAVAGADEVLAHIERVYADRTKKTLHYVRHYYEARTGRFVSSVEYAYVQPRSDPTGADLTVSAALVAKQVAKTKATFGV